MINNKINTDFKIKITLISFLSFVLFFNIWKLIFFYSYIEEFSGSTELYIKSFIVGLRGDSFIAALLSLPIFIISNIPKIKFTRSLKIGYYAYLIILYLIIGFLNVIDLEFFKELGSHINMMAQMYGFDTGGQHGEVWMQVWVSYPIFIYLFMIFFFSYLTYRIVKYHINKKGNFQSQYTLKYARYLLIIIFLILGTNIFQKNPFNPKKSFFSQDDMMANHLAVNSIQNYIYSLVSQPNLSFYNEQLAYKEADAIIDENRNGNSNTSLKIDNPNIILIILESHVGTYCNYLNPNLKENVTPFLDSLSRKSINFKNCYANGTRTAYGLSAIMCSWAVTPGYPLIRFEQYQDSNHSNPPTFSSIMKNVNPNYNNLFMYGGDSNFDEMKLFVESNQFDQIIDHSTDPVLKQFELDNHNQGVSPWGVFDSHLFNRSIDLMDDKASNHPQFISILSTTNHLPWVIPSEYRNQIPNYPTHKKDFEIAKRTMKYVDNALKDFFNNAQNKDWFDDTIFIITADHGLSIYKEHINDPRNARIPFIIYNSRLEPKEMEKIVSQIDILPTLLDLIDKNEYFNPDLFGCSGFKGKNGFAFRSNDSNIQWIEDGYVYSYNIGIDFEEFYTIDNFKTHRVSDSIKNELEKKCKSYAQTAASKIKEEKD